MRSLEGDKERWQRETLGPVLGRFPERKESFEGSSGIPVDRLYVPDDIDAEYLEELGFQSVSLLTDTTPKTESFSGETKWM